VRVVRVAGRVLGRPSERQLHHLAQADRPAPPITVPTAAELGIHDHLGDGRAAIAAGRAAEALHHFGLLLEDHPDQPWGWHGRGDALQLLGDHEGALAAYRRAASLQPAQGLHHLGRANALEALGQEQAAAEATRRGLALDPSLHWMRSPP
jgi:tetratricopeptide (TPR) repeat protein